MTCDNSIYLVMIVKNEAHIIADTIKNVTQSFPLKGFIICDTGSTDDTVKIVSKTINETGLFGVVVNHAWHNFAYNRNLALKEARERIMLYDDNGSDPYILMFDADDSIKVNTLSSYLVLPNKLTADAYSLQFKTHSFSYVRPLLIRLSSNWEYEGIVHECLCDKTPNKTNTTVHLSGDYTIISGRSGSRNQDPEKYKKDALMLEDALNDDTTPEYLLPRYAFYCAQSWKDHGEKEKAIRWYKLVITKYDNWSEEKYCACLKIGELLQSIARTEEAIYYLLSASSYNPNRLEAITEAAKIYLTNKQYHTAHMILLPYADTIQKTSCDDISFLFSSPVIYIYDALLQLTLSSYYNDDINTLKLSFMELMTRMVSFTNVSDFPYHSQYLDAFLNGLQFYFRKIHINDSYELMTIFESIKKLLVDYSCRFHSFELGLQKCHQIRQTIDDKFTDFAKQKTITTKLSGSRCLLSSNNKEQNVLLTVTTCKRLDLFIKTINSILDCFSIDDISMISEWMIVDDGSSYDDIKIMETLFPFITIIRKNKLADENGQLLYPEGHRGSMNLIYDTLVELKPKYWLHIEDDWLFLKKEHYLTRAINYLENPTYKTHHVKQVLFNKGYGETIGDVIVPCGIRIINDDGFLIHVKNEKDMTYLSIPNCNYWNHFSFRPSLILTEAILDIGNFNSENTFFEADYANKFYDKGYRSGYFDDITCIHLGKLSGIRGDVTSIKNAYELNNSKQF